MLLKKYAPTVLATQRATEIMHFNKSMKTDSYGAPLRVRINNKLRKPPVMRVHSKSKLHSNGHCLIGQWCLTITLKKSDCAHPFCYIKLRLIDIRYIMWEDAALDRRSSNAIGFFLFICNERLRHRVINGCWKSEFADS